MYSESCFDMHTHTHTQLLVLIIYYTHSVSPDRTRDRTDSNYVQRETPAISLSSVIFVLAPSAEVDGHDNDDDDDDQDEQDRCQDAKDHTLQLAGTFL